MQTKVFLKSTNHNDTGDIGKHLLLHLKEGGNQGTCGLAIRVREGEVTQGEPTFHLDLRFQGFVVHTGAKNPNICNIRGCYERYIYCT